MQWIQIAQQLVGAYPEALFYLELALALAGVASFICALTPTPRDDILIGKVYKYLEMLAGNVGHAKEHAPHPPPPTEKKLD
jgi:hypothetical protein